MTTATVATKTDVGTHEWRIDDRVFRLRQWASDIPHKLPIDRPDATIGAGSGAMIRLVDPTRRVSRVHARAIRVGEQWLLRDLKSKNGLRVDGALRDEVVLVPGIEIGIGGLGLIAESPRLVELRAFVSRLLGWSNERLEAVDLALRAIRTAATRRSALVVCGDGDLVAIVRGLHRRALGDERPFVVCDPRRLSGEETVRSAENYDSGIAALEAAAGGTLCVWAKRLPRDFGAVAAALRSPGNRVQLVVCTHVVGDGRQFLATPIVIPPLTTRRGELMDIIDRYTDDARVQLGAAPLAPLDREWVATQAASTLPEIEKGTLRVIALRKTGGDIEAAAELLGMSSSALARWLGRRKLPGLGKRRHH